MFSKCKSVTFSKIDRHELSFYLQICYASQVLLNLHLQVLYLGPFKVAVIFAFLQLYFTTSQPWDYEITDTVNNTFH